MSTDTANAVPGDVAAAWLAPLSRARAAAASASASARAAIQFRRSMLSTRMPNERSEQDQETEAHEPDESRPCVENRAPHGGGLERGEGAVLEGASTIGPIHSLLAAS
jgi:hypothetical protein